MEVDARTLQSRGVIADVCIIGAGPGGLTLARELATRPLRIVVLESGGRTSDPEVQALCAGTTTGDAYARLEATRRRQAGGTAHAWNTWVGAEVGAKYVALDAVDFEAREWLPGSGWPFDKTALEGYYRQARSACGLSPGGDQADRRSGTGRPALPLEPGPLTTETYEFGPARLFTDVYVAELREAANVLLCLHATAVELETDAQARSIMHVRAACLTGKRLWIQARVVVLAAGAIENARLLLLSRRVRRGGLGNEGDHVGRYFMEHPRDVACQLVPADPDLFDRCGLYDWHRRGEAIIAGRFSFCEEARRRDRLPAMAVTLQPRPREFRHPSVEALRVRVLGPRRRQNSEWFALRGKRRRFGAFDLRINLEQAPDPDNRITLSAERDRLGVPRPAIHWRWRERDQRHLARIRSILADELQRRGIGRVVIDPAVPVDPNAHHHMGTTRMHRDPRHGVVDEHARVHGVSNLFVVGSSVFPTGGFANPTLTIVALALRLADHLKSRI